MIPYPSLRRLCLSVTLLRPTGHWELSNKAGGVSSKKPISDCYQRLVKKTLSFDQLVQGVMKHAYQWTGTLLKGSRCPRAGKCAKPDKANGFLSDPLQMKQCPFSQKGPFLGEGGHDSGYSHLLCF